MKLQYKEDMGEYPTTGEGLIALVIPPTRNEEKRMGPYLEEIPKDP